MWLSIKKITKKILRRILKTFDKELTESQWQAIVQFLKFCVVGVSNTLISLAVYYLFVVADPSLYIVGNIVGYIAGIVNSYMLNSRFVFHKKDNTVRVIIKTSVSYGTTLALGTFTIYVFVNILMISEVIAPLLNSLITIPLNFILIKYWAMK